MSAVVEQLINSIFFPCSGAPEAPSVVRLSVSSSTTLTVSFQEPQCFNSSVITKYKGIAQIAR